MRKFVAIFKHQQPFVAEMTISALREKGIVCYMQETTVTGLELSPVAPVAAPGIEYAVYVHKTEIVHAKKVIDELPIDKELLNVLWVKSPDRKRQKLLWLYWIIALIIPTLGMLFLYLYKWLVK